MTKKAECTACGRTFKLYQNGTIARHGHGAGDTPCVGSQLAPKGTATTTLAAKRYTMSEVQLMLQNEYFKVYPHGLCDGDAISDARMIDDGKHATKNLVNANVVQRMLHEVRAYHGVVPA